MTEREEILEMLLEHSRVTIEFLHGCLIHPNHSYAFPEMTLNHLSDLEAILPARDYCIHSRVNSDCEGCQQGVKTREIYAKFEEVYREEK